MNHKLVYADIDSTTFTCIAMCVCFYIKKHHHHHQKVCFYIKKHIHNVIALNHFFVSVIFYFIFVLNMQ